MPSRFDTQLRIQISGNKRSAARGNQRQSFNEPVTNRRTRVLVRLSIPSAMLMMMIRDEAVKKITKKFSSGPSGEFQIRKQLPNC